MTARAIPGLPAGIGLRQRPRADGTLRLWWEPTVEERGNGARPVDLDPDRPTWSVREARRLKAETTRAGRPRRTVGQTVGHVIDDYEAGLRFRKRSAKTQATYRQEHRVIRARWGDTLAADLTKPVMRTWYEALYDRRGRYAALNLMHAMSRLLAHAELRGWRPEGSNPCFRLGMEVPKGRRRNASWAELDALLAAARTAGLPVLAAAIALSLFAGSRQTDVLAARREAFGRVTVPGERPGEPPRTVLVWFLTRSKRGNDGAIPLHPEAEALIAPLLAAGPAEGPLFLDDRTGRPWSQGLLDDRWREARTLAAKAGHPALAGLQFRDLRRTFGAMSRAGGARKDDVGDVLGNSAAVNPQLADVYMAPDLLTTLRAVDAIRRPETPVRRKA